MSSIRTIAIAILFLAIASTLALASVPPMISYQGKLMQPSGAPVADGTVSIQFAIYDVPTGGTALWSETNTGVQVKNGLFSVLLGSVTLLPSSIFDGSARFFGMKVGSDPEVAPRQQVASVAFAVRAGMADTANTVPDGAISTSKLADSVVLTSKLADASVVSSKLASGLMLASPTITAPKIDQISEVTAGQGTAFNSVLIAQQGITSNGPIDIGTNVLNGFHHDTADDSIYSFVPGSAHGWGVIRGRSSSYPIYCFFIYDSSSSPFIHFISFIGFGGLQNTAITSIGQCPDGSITLSCTGNTFYVCNRYGRTVSLGYSFFGN